VKELPFMNLSPVYIEISQGWLKALRENDGLDVPLDRSANGQLTAACKETLALSLHKFLQRKGWQTRTRALCAIGCQRSIAATHGLAICGAGGISETDSDAD